MKVTNVDLLKNTGRNVFSTHEQEGFFFQIYVLLQDLSNLSPQTKFVVNSEMFLSMEWS